MSYVRFSETYVFITLGHVPDPDRWKEDVEDVPEQDLDLEADPEANQGISMTLFLVSRHAGGGKGSTRTTRMTVTTL